MSSIDDSLQSGTDRRCFLRGGLRAAVAVGLGIGITRYVRIPDPELETLILVPEGFTPRIVALSGFQSSLNSRYLWHASPDGGGCFETFESGWIYVSNSEHKSKGGVGALRFDSNGTIEDSYPILRDSRKNCSGGKTPWGSWLSCEEVPDGRVWECDPYGVTPSKVLPGLGSFKHESACVDPVTHQVYLTEDRKDGCLYRFTPTNAVLGGTTDLTRGLLEVAVVNLRLIDWVAIPDPDARLQPVREQVPGVTKFNGGEGIDFSDGLVRFTTKGDNRIWELDLSTRQIRVIHELKGHLKNIDDITHAPDGGMLVAEDGKGMQVLYIGKATGRPFTLLRFPQHKYSEITGIAFDPGGTRLYFSSQRGSTDEGSNGITFELSGDFDSLVKNPAQAIKLVEWKLDHHKIVLATTCILKES